MKIINPESNYLSTEGLTPYQFIEKIGRTCYKSLDKITEDSAVKFVSGLVKSRHLAMLEHHWVHIMYRGDCESLKMDFDRYAYEYDHNMGETYDYTHHVEITRNRYLYISAPLRVFLEFAESSMKYAEEYKNQEVTKFNASMSRVYCMLNSVCDSYPEVFEAIGYKKQETPYDYTFMFDVMSEDDLCNNIACDMIQFSTDSVVKEIMKHRVHSVLFVCDRGVSHEFVRHRPASFAQESTRYCNYSKDKFGNEITVIKPFFFNRFDTTASNVLYDDSTYSAWLLACEKCEDYYFALLERGATPQEARTVLPNSLKTEIIITANEKEWQHIINLRYLGTTGSPHPQMKESMSLIVKDLWIESNGRLNIK